MVAKARGFRKVTWVPAFQGKSCPVKLKGTSLEEVKEWAAEVRKLFEQKGEWLALHGLEYCVTHFYDIFSPECALVKSHLNTLYGCENQGRSADDQDVA